MLEKIICIDNVGVIRKGVPKALDLQKISLIYADNARGKSTLSSLLSACSDSDAQEVTQRKTIGALDAQKVVMRFQPSGSTSGFNAEFDGVAWKGDQPNLHVFNQTFVDRNVYASSGVLPEHRQALLSLVLGDAAVVQREKFDEQAALQLECAKKVAASESALHGFRGNFTVDQFISVKKAADIELQIANVDKQISEARAADKIAKRPNFRTVVAPSFDLNHVAEVLTISFDSLSVKAEEAVKEHLAKHKGARTGSWVAEGMNHLPEAECPFCGQPTDDLELLKAYRSYFDGSYSDHLARIQKLSEDVEATLGNQQLLSWSASHQFNQGLLSVWAESLGLIEVPTLGYEGGVEILGAVKLQLLEFIEEKKCNPLAVIHIPMMKICEQLVPLISMAEAYNVQITKLNELVAAYKAKLEKPDLVSLAGVRAHLVVYRNRYEPEVVALVNEVIATRADYKIAGKKKIAARHELDSLMAEVLSTFQQSINDWLNKFGAPFRVEQFASTYRGGGLRSEYVLKVRGATVNVGSGDDGDLPFHSALSEGDKRTLAFAFFLAQLFAAPQRHQTTVVLDDVFTSLDKHRRHNTVEALLRIASECAQVIALGHDAHFLREIKKRANKKKLGQCVELVLQRDSEDYSYLDAFDLDDYCSSEYYKHYVLVERFVGGDHSVSLLEVAKALRLLVEGHMHRCFPKKFKEGQTVGEMLDQVKNATSKNPLVRLQPLHSDLVDFNEFAAAFHHDTSGGYLRTEVNAAELLPFAKGALGFIQVRSFK